MEILRLSFEPVLLDLEIQTPLNEKCKVSISTIKEHKQDIHATNRSRTILQIHQARKIALLCWYASFFLFFFLSHYTTIL